MNTVSVQLEGTSAAIASVAWIELCDGDGCSSSEPTRAASSTVPGNGAPSYIADDERLGYWVIDVAAGMSEDVTVTAFAQDGSSLAVANDALTWPEVREGDCEGGPVDAGPIRLSVPG